MQIVERAHRCYREQRWEDLRSCFHAAAMLHTLVWPSGVLGRDDFVDAVMRAASTVRFHLTPQRLELLADEAVIVDVSVRLPSGRGWIHTSATEVYTLVDGLIFRTDFFGSRHAAVACFERHGATLGLAAAAG